MRHAQKVLAYAAEVKRERTATEGAICKWGKKKTVTRCAEVAKALRASGKQSKAGPA